MYISTKDGHPHGFIGREGLELFDEPITLMFMVSRRPMIVEIVEDLDPAVELIEEGAQQAGLPDGLERIHHAGCQAVNSQFDDEASIKIGDSHIFSSQTRRG